jgi:hypothetical protein
MPAACEGREMQPFKNKALITTYEPMVKNENTKNEVCKQCAIEASKRASRAGKAAAAQGRFDTSQLNRGPAIAWLTTKKRPRSGRW